MAKYKVTWEIELDASSHNRAAIRSALIFRDRKSTALHFFVSDVDTGEYKLVDLNDLHMNGLLSKKILNL